MVFGRVKLEALFSPRPDFGRSGGGGGGKLGEVQWSSSRPL